MTKRDELKEEIRAKLTGKNYDDWFAEVADFIIQREAGLRAKLREVEGELLKRLSDFIDEREQIETVHGASFAILKSADIAEFIKRESAALHKGEGEGKDA